MKSFFKKLSIAMLMLTALYLPTKADIVTVPLVQGSLTSTCPFYTYWMDGAAYILYTNTEITAAGGATGTIKSLALNISSIDPDFDPINGFKIFMQNTTATTITAPVAVGWTQVYSVAVFNPLVTGWNTFSFNPANYFSYDGTKNLLIKICFNNASYSNYSNVMANAAAGMCLQRYQDMPTDDGCITEPSSTLSPSRPNLRFDIEMNPKLIAVYPPEGAIITAGSVVPETSLNQPAFSFKRTATQPAIYMTYTISGPSNNPQVIYRAAAEGTATYRIPIPTNLVGDPNAYKFNFTHAYGIAAHSDVNISNPNLKNTGRLDLSNPGISGGEYTVTAVFEIQGFPALTETRISKFIIALPWDITVAGITQPVTKNQLKYPLLGATGVPVRANVMNIGTQPVDSFSVKVVIYKGANIVMAPQPFIWVNKTTPLQTGAIAPITFPDFRPTTVGEYRVVVTTTLLQTQDLDPSNNIFPLPPNEHIFQVSYGTDAKVDQVLAPSGTTYIGRPITPSAKFSNQGVEDISEVPATMVIRDPNGVIVYDEVITVPSIPYTGSGYAIGTFKTTFIPHMIGVYTVTTNINPKGEGDPSDNTLTTTFTVVDALNGVYTISASGIGTRNYITIESAVQSLFERGVTGPVVFELPDNEYYVGHTSSYEPAIDFRSKIVGVDATNTITFRPSNSKTITRGGVIINLSSANGIGFIFGQTVNYPSPIAPVNSVNGSALKRIYANSEGYITFDGGEQKSLKFMIHSPSTQQFRTAFYMAEGAKNITVKNCLIEGQTSTTSLASSLPLVNFSFVTDIGKFTYEDNVRVTGSFSAGILLRNKTPYDAKSSNNFYSLDTIQISNILIENNEISHFGYGVVSLGIGILNYKKGIVNELLTYYNHDNKITKNLMHDLGRAGVFMGYEKNSEVSYNHIYNVMGTSDAAGIIVGGEARGTGLGYHNTDLMIVSNEINDIMANTISYGVKVEQSRNYLQETVSATKIFPNTPENITVANNAIWDIKANLLTTHRVGIYLATERNSAAPDFNTMMVAPKDSTYLSLRDKIVNNTIIIPDDNGAANTGNIAGLSIVGVREVMVYNNAIAILDQNSAPSVETNAAIFYMGKKPKAMDNNFDRNAFWLVNPNAAYYRFVETKADNSILNIGFASEFKTLNQWVNWTGADKYSVTYNFLNDLVFIGSNPTKLRVKSNPTPIGSKLNNRGTAVEGINFDIDGNPRGLANQRYDIGAFEFAGRVYTTDLEVSSITAPGAYTDLRTTSMFSDAEYIMTKAPIDVKTIIRNNGSILAVDKLVKVEIFREDTLGNFTSAPIVTKSVKATISTTDDQEISFGLADGLNNDDWTPATYSQLTGYNVPAHFKTMMPNVTPRYKIVISLPSDEVPSNNVLSNKIVRFYLKRSGLNMLLSLENSHITTVGTPTPTTLQLQQIAGRVNADSLIRAFNDIGWYQTKGENDHDFDLFERSGWETRSVNYPMYRTLAWSDASLKPLTISEINDLKAFTEAGRVGEKKNLIFASQEVARLNSLVTYPEGLSFLYNVLRVSPSSVRTFVGPSDQIVGVTLARNIQMDIIPTGFTGDTDPQGDIVTINNDGNGISRIGYYYVTPTSVGMNSKIMSVATSSIGTNVIYAGLDWRHFADPEAFIRSTMDYIETNGGTIIPVELLSFNANSIANRVELNWNTASEVNSSRFDVERADVNTTGAATFSKIDEKAASGNTNIITEYGPVIDRNVTAGKSYAYRLKMIDFNGDFKYSNEQIVTLDLAEGTLSINQIAPNPAINFANLEISLASDASVTVQIYDMSGRMTASQTFNNMNAGTNNISLDTKALVSGSYRLVISQNDAQATANITVVK